MGTSKEFLEKSFDELERKEILSNSKYYVDGATDYLFTPQDILHNGVMPKTSNRAETVRAVLEVRKYIISSTNNMPELLGMNDYISSAQTFMKNLESDLFVIFVSDLDDALLNSLIGDDDDLTAKLALLIHDL